MNDDDARAQPHLAKALRTRAPLSTLQAEGQDWRLEVHVLATAVHAIPIMP